MPPTPTAFNAQCPLTPLLCLCAPQDALRIYSEPAAVEFDEDEQIKYYLPEGLLWEIDRVHMRNRLPIFSSNRVGREWDGEGEIGEPIP